MVGWHHQFNKREFEQSPGDSRQRILACCSPRVTKSWIRLSNWTTHCYMLWTEIPSHINLSILLHQGNFISLSNCVCSIFLTMPPPSVPMLYRKDISQWTLHFGGILAEVQRFIIIAEKHSAVCRKITSKSYTENDREMLRKKSHRIYCESCLPPSLRKGLSSLDCCLWTTASIALSIS